MVGGRGEEKEGGGERGRKLLQGVIYFLVGSLKGNEGEDKGSDWLRAASGFQR